MRKCSCYVTKYKEVFNNNNHNYDDNSNNNQDSVYATVVIAKPLRECTKLMNAE